MQLYVVVGSDEGQKALAVYSTRERALTFIDERGAHHGQVIERSVPPGYQYPGEVYAAHTVHADEGTLVFADLFANPREAEEAAGADGKVLTFHPDGKAVEGMH